MKNDSKEIGQNLRFYRNNKGMSLEEVSKVSNISVSALSRIEAGTQKLYTDQMITLANVFDVSLNDLVGYDNPNEEEGLSRSYYSINPTQLDQNFTRLLNQYLPSKNETFKGHPMGELVRQTIPSTIQEALGLADDDYHIVGSVGQGQWAEVPWVSIFLPQITKSATKGYYIVYLINADCSGLYLSLNQGWTYFNDKYGSRKGITMIRTSAQKIRQELRFLSPNLSLQSIDLRGRGPLAKGYEAGHISGKYYDAGQIPDALTLAQDLQELLNVYDEIDNLIGERTVAEFNDALLSEEDDLFLESSKSEEDFQKRVNEIQVEEKEEMEEMEEEKRRRKDPIKSREGKETYGRDSAISAAAIKMSHHQCQLDPSHTTFISKSTSKPFMEAHHIVPMSAQKDFKYDLDRTTNIAVLCPNCHRLLHHGLDEEKEKLIRKLFQSRRESLEKIGIEITPTALLNLYNVGDLED